MENKFDRHSAVFCNLLFQELAFKITIFTRVQTESQLLSSYSQLYWSYWPVCVPLDFQIRSNALLVRFPASRGRGRGLSFPVPVLSRHVTQAGNPFVCIIHKVSMRKTRGPLSAILSWTSGRI